MANELKHFTITQQYSNSSDPRAGALGTAAITYDPF